MRTLALLGTVERDDFVIDMRKSIAREIWKFPD